MTFDIIADSKNCLGHQQYFLVRSLQLARVQTSFSWGSQQFCGVVHALGLFTLKSQWQGHEDMVVSDQQCLPALLKEIALLTEDKGFAH